MEFSTARAVFRALVEFVFSLDGLQRHRWAQQSLGHNRHASRLYDPRPFERRYCLANSQAISRLTPPTLPIFFLVSSHVSGLRTSLMKPCPRHRSPPKDRIVSLSGVIPP